MLGLIVLGLIGVIALTIIGFLALFIVPFSFVLIPAVIVGALLGGVSAIRWVAGLAWFIIIGEMSLLKMIVQALF